jgi:DNA mismatch repair protein MutS2
MRDSGTAVQDAIVTVRNDRFVIPIKADFRGKVNGVAHGFSSSGATVFIEPLESIEANNELQSLKGKEEREVARILFDLTEELREQLPAVEMAVEAVTELDFIRAKVEFARKFAASIPEISTDETLELTDARHPLLEESLRETENEIVPVSFSLTKENAVMIISGANAGGKTVVLKTAGLLSMMAVSGLPVPAKQAVIPFYRSILADIGDHQSLAANLSTFSSHMSNIAGMLRECTSPSLVLLDEVGTGTDPEEGSALGVAIVDHFRRKCNAQVMASTHYRGLKIYAANDPSIINASVEFNEKTLQPTYKLLIGLAGASSGIEIARRFGILPEVIEEARRNLDVSAQEAENYLRRLQTETAQATDLRVALEEEREATALKYASLEIETSKKEKERQRQFEKELAQTIDEFDRQSKAFIEGIEDKALKTRLEKERQTRKAELNRAVMSKVRGESRVASHESRFVDTDESVAVAVGSRVVTSFGNIGVVEKMYKEVS